jgi:DNA-binding NtrC family response regulator
VTHDLNIAAADAIPPIVLLMDDDRDTLDMYSTHFERQGLWVASATSCANAMSAAAELKPDLIVTDMGAGAGQKGAAIVDAIRHDALLNETPIIVLTGSDPDSLPGRTVQDASIVLVKPVVPDALLSQIRLLLAKGRELRLRSGSAREKTERLVRKSADLMEHAGRIADTIDKAARTCPSCGKPLEWLERGTVAGVEYDYFRWCDNGCGLYCYQRSAPADRRWVKLV